MKNFFNRAVAVIVGGIIGIFSYPIAVLGIIPFSMAVMRVRTGSWLAAIPLGLILGIALLPVTAIVALSFPFLAPTFLYKIVKSLQAKRANIRDAYDKLNQFLHHQPEVIAYPDLTQAQIQQLQWIIANTKDEGEKTECEQLLSTIQGDDAHTNIDLNDYLSLKDPITIKQIVKKGNEVTEHYQMYEKDEFLEFNEKCNKGGKIAFNPLIRSHEFKLDRNNQCVCKSVGNDDATYTYEFHHGFAQKFLQTCNRVKDILKKWANQLPAQAPSNLSSTAFIQKKVPVEKRKMEIDSAPSLIQSIADEARLRFANNNANQSALPNPPTTLSMRRP